MHKISEIRCFVCFNFLLLEFNVNSEARSGKLENARKMHAELEEGLKQWRFHCNQMQERAAEEAAKRATQQYLEKKRKAEMANKSKEEHHTLVMSRFGYFFFIKFPFLN